MHAKDVLGRDGEQAAAGHLEGCGADKIVRVAWSVADLAERPRPGLDEVNVAIGQWLGVPR